MADTLTVKPSKATRTPSTVQFKENKSPVDTSVTLTKAAFTVRSPSTPSPSPIITHKPNKSPDLLAKSLGDYYFDRFEDKVDPYKGLYSDSKVFYAPASEFALLRHELACLDNQLVNARIAWKEERKALSKRWDTAIAKHNLVEENIPKFNGYYRDSFAKRDRALQGIARERDLIEVKERELRRLNKEKGKLQEIKQEQDDRLEKFSVFRTYLDTVKQSSQGEYGDIREIIDRFAVLADARNNLLGRTESTRDSVQRRQKALERDMLMKSNEVLAYRNFLSELMEYQNALHEQVLRLEDNLLRIKTTAAQRTLIIGQIKMAIRNLYLQVCKHMHRNARITPEDTLGQLVDIRHSVREMYKLAKDIKHMLRNAFLTAEAEAAAREKQRKKSLERQRRLDKLGKGKVMDPRELFGLRRRSSAEKEKKGLLDAFSNVTTATNATARVPNATVEKTDEFVGEMGIQGGGGGGAGVRESWAGGSMARR